MNQAQLKELSFLKDWNLTILDFLLQKFREEESLKMNKKLVIETFNRSDLKGMQLIYYSNNEWVNTLPPLIELEELNEILKTKFGSDLSEAKVDPNKLNWIIQKDFIANDEEYRFIQERREDIYPQNTHTKEVEILDKLLTDYEKKKDQLNRIHRKKRMSEKNLEELSFLKDWNLVIIEFLMKKDKQILSFKISHQTIMDAFNRSDLRGMRLAFKDYNEEVKELSSPELDELNQILKDKFGFDLSKFDKANSAKIKRIVKKGVVQNEEEYRLLLNRVEEIYADTDKADEVETLNKLLAGYDNQKEK